MIITLSPFRERQAIISQLSDLSSLHETVLQKIAERNNGIGDRLRRWEEYRQAQDSLFAWLKQMEKEKLKLNLKHVQVDRISDILKQIEVMIRVF